MNLNDFINFKTKNCPLCEKPLTLYAETSINGLWKASLSPNEIYQFHQIKQSNKYYDIENGIFLLENKKDNLNISFSEPELYQKSKRWELFFFLLCGDDAIEDYHDDYTIRPFNSCYYRSSLWMEFNKNFNEWNLNFKNNFSSTNNIPIRDEIFTFKYKMNDDRVKNYHLSIGYEDNEMLLIYFITNASQRELIEKDEDPNIEYFEEKLPIPTNRLDFSPQNRGKLIRKFDSWILLS